jgi:hypothetical protein
MKRVNLFLVAAFVAASAVFVGCDKVDNIEPKVESHDENTIITVEDESDRIITEFTIVEDMPTFPKSTEIDLELLDKMMRSLTEDMVQRLAENMMRSLMESSLIIGE